MKLLKLISVGLLALQLTSCGPKAFVKGTYDNVDRENLLNDRWSETDMQKTVETMVQSLVAHPVVASAKNRPFVMVTNLQNKTSEVIDTQSIMDMVRVELSKTGKVAFIDKEARKDIAEEYEYQGSGMVDRGSQKGPGAQKGVRLIKTKFQKRATF